MKKLFLLPLLLTYVGQTYSITCQATILKHEQKNKTVLLLGDVHAQATANMKALGCKDEAIDAFENAGQKQKAIFSDFIKNLLNTTHKKPVL